MRWIFVGAALALSACNYTDKVYLKSQATGQVVTCGPYKANDFAADGAAAQERQCIQDYKEQGFIRVPAP